jgi:hypothetical protein
MQSGSHYILTQLRELSVEYLEQLDAIKFRDSYSRDDWKNDFSFTHPEELIRFRERSLHDLKEAIHNLINNIDQYHLVQNNEKDKLFQFIRHTSLYNGKFYDYAIAEFAFRKIEPEYYKVIHSKISRYGELLKQLDNCPR